MGDFNTSPAIAEEKEEIKISNEKKKTMQRMGKNICKLTCFIRDLYTEHRDFLNKKTNSSI